jgi:signal transduction histidine kinase
VGELPRFLVTSMRETLPAGTETRWVSVGSACIASAVCVATVVATTRYAIDVGGPPERQLPVPAAVVALLAVVPVITAVWLFCARRPPVSAGLSLAAVATLVPLWSAWPWLGSGVRAATLAWYPVAVVGVLHVVLGWGGRPRGDMFYRRAATLLATAAVLTHLLGYDPFADLGCTRTCEHVEPALAAILSTRSVVALVSALTVTAAIAAIVAALRGRGRAPVVVAAAVLLALGGLAVGSAARWSAWGDTEAWSVTLLLQPVLVSIVAAAAVVVEGRSWRVRAAVDRLVARLSASEGRLPELGGGIRDVHFAVPGTDRWVDAAGTDVGAPPGRWKHVVLTQDDAPVLRLMLTRGADEVDVIASLTQASRLALRNAQLSAVALARLSDVRASQRRVVAASDAERRRIERDLHDGAQQRLIGVSFQLRIAQSRMDRPAASILERAERHVRDALRRLRELTHGMFPRVLVDEGLEAAVEELVSASPAAATLEVRLGEPVNAEVALAAYATVVAALRHARAARGREPARVALQRIGDDLVVRVEIDGSGSGVEWTEVADRVGAVGGRLSVSTGADRVSVSAVIPCGS